MVRRPAILALALLALGSTASSTSSASSSATTATITGSTTSTGPSRVLTPTTATAAAGPGCDSNQIVVVIQASFVGAGSVAEELGFRNVSTTRCTLYGYPGVAALDASGHQMEQATRNPYDGRPKVVTLEPGRLAEALVQGSDGSAVECTAFTQTFLVTPPGMTRSTQVSTKPISASIGAGAPCSIGVTSIGPEGPQPVS
jgi:hypothetical protein